MILRFLNFELGFDGNGSQLQGSTHKVYGKPSRWDGVNAAQCVEAEFKDAREMLAALRDIKDAWHLALRRWIPVPEFQPKVDFPAAVMDFFAGYQLAMDGHALPKDANEAMKSGHKSCRDEVPSGTPATPPPEGWPPVAPPPHSEPTATAPSQSDYDDLHALTFFALRKIAKQEDCWNEEIDSKAGAVNAILEKRQGKKLAAV